MRSLRLTSRKGPLVTANALDAHLRLPLEESLEHPAERFRSRVTAEIARLDDAAREPLRGDYLFVIDGAPRFIVVILKSGVRSAPFEAQALPFDEPAQGRKAAGEPVFVAHLDIASVIEGTAEVLRPAHDAPRETLTYGELAASARARVETDKATLARLLAGTMKAKTAFLAGKVRIDGDLPGFLRLIGMLKSRGVQAPGEAPGVLTPCNGCS